MEINYDIYVECDVESDVVSFDNKEEAIKEANDWAKRLDYKYDVLVIECRKENKIVYRTKKEDPTKSYYTPEDVKRLRERLGIKKPAEEEK